MERLIYISGLLMFSLWLGGCNQKSSNIVDPVYLEIVDDIHGNPNGRAVTAEELNSLRGIHRAVNGVNYTRGFQLAHFNDSHHPTTVEIQAVIDGMNTDYDYDRLPMLIDLNDTNPDIDGDGIPDGADADQNQDLEDKDQDGIIDDADADDDGKVGTDIGKTDTDGDGIIDTYDLDDDGDGLLDRYDPNPINPDSDGDGLLDGEDPHPKRIDHMPVILMQSDFRLYENVTDFHIDLNATDEDNHQLYYTLYGIDKDAFYIDSKRRIIVFKNIPDYEHPQDKNGDNHYMIGVRVRDASNLTAETNLTISVENVNEYAPIITVEGVENGIKDLNITAKEHNSSFAVKIKTDDKDANESLRYTLEGEDAIHFTLEAQGKSDAILTFVTTPDYADPQDYDKNNIYCFSIVVKDSGDKNDTINLCIKVTSAAFDGGMHIIDTAALGARSIYTADFDGDGDLDVAATLFDDNSLGNEGGIRLYENNQGLQLKVVLAESLRVAYLITTDVDCDGKIDIVASLKNSDGTDNRISWYRNQGNWQFSDEKRVSNIAGEPYGVFASDIDYDGDIDLAAAVLDKNYIKLYKQNTDGNFTVSELNVSAPYSVVFADVDQDGYLDLVAAASDGIVWFRNKRNGSFTKKIYLKSGGRFVDVSVVDIDQDGKNDLVGTYTDDEANKTAWYRNINGIYSEHLIARSLKVQPKYLDVNDIDGDGDMDLLTATWKGGKDILWYDNDGKGNFTIVNTVPAAGADADLVTADLDNDGDLDIISASATENTIVWIENKVTHTLDSSHTDMVISSAPKIVDRVKEAVNETFAVDIDRDGDIDIVAAFSTQGVAWYENDHGDYRRHTIVSNVRASALYAVDIDYDGDIDIIAGLPDENRTLWYRNDGMQHFESIVITHIKQNKLDIDINDIDVADMDGDGWLDILIASKDREKNNTFIYYNRLPQEADPDSGDTSDLFARVWVGSLGDTPNPCSVEAIDIDQDGTMDVVTASTSTNEILWFKGTKDRKAYLFTKYMIDDTGTHPRSIKAADLNRDGNIDIVVAYSNKIIQYLNSGSESFNIKQTTADIQETVDIKLADINRDGMIDLVASSEMDSNKYYLSWFKNSGKANFTRYEVETIASIRNIYISDLDRDGDMDIIGSASLIGYLNWYENTTNSK